MERKIKIENHYFFGLYIKKIIKNKIKSVLVGIESLFFKWNYDLPFLLLILLLLFSCIKCIFRLCLEEYWNRE